MKNMWRDRKGHNKIDNNSTKTVSSQEINCSAKASFSIPPGVQIQAIKGVFRLDFFGKKKFLGFVKVIFCFVFLFFIFFGEMEYGTQSENLELVLQ